ncbi:MAG: guanylate kinase [Deltaproteobacteria bacterium]|nr:guanylate kinase [Deltaproteobacteria bacterium]
MSRGLLVVISAPSGTGKTTVVGSLLTGHPEFLHSVSYTTRPKRIGEREGSDYCFVDPPAFERLIDTGAFVEWALVHGAYYGTPRAPLEAALAVGRTVVLDLDVQGARALRRAYPETIAIFLLPPSREVLIRRLTGRGTDKPDAVARRLGEAEREIAAQDEYDHVLVNDSVEAVCAQIAGIVRRARGSPQP